MHAHAHTQSHAHARALAGARSRQRRRARAHTHTCAHAHARARAYAHAHLHHLNLWYIDLQNMCLCVSKQPSGYVVGPHRPTMLDNVGWGRGWAPPHGVMGMHATPHAVTAFNGGRSMPIKQVHTGCTFKTVLCSAVPTWSAWNVVSVSYSCVATLLFGTGVGGLQLLGGLYARPVASYCRRRAASRKTW